MSCKTFFTVELLQRRCEGFPKRSFATALASPTLSVSLSVSVSVSRSRSVSRSKIE
jgi:hypothetical protein